MSFYISRAIPFQQECYIPRGWGGIKIGFIFLPGKETFLGVFLKPCTEHGIARLPYPILGNIKRYTHTKHPLKVIIFPLTLLSFGDHI